MRFKPVFNRRLSAPLLGLAIFTGIWFVLSLTLSSIVVASPLAAFTALLKLAGTSTFWTTLSITAQRFLLGFALGALSGGIMGILGGFFPFWGRAFEPIRWIMMSIPPVILVTISMILFGMGSLQTILVTAFLILPIMYVNTIEGIHAIDSRLVEMGHLYRAGRSLMMREIYLPGIASHIISGLTLSAGLGIRIVVLAEVLGAYSGIGHKFSLARVNLETEELYAWILACLFIIAVLEFGIFLPLRRCLTRWQTPSEKDARHD